MKQPAPEPLTIGNSQLRAVFQRVNDRWQHRIEIHDGAAWRVALESVEGHANDPWPPSPAIQQTHLQARTKRGPLLLGVGMSGTCHWSLSCHVPGSAGDDDDAHPPPGLLFEVAGRAKSPFQRMGSTFRVAPGIRLNFDGQLIVARTERFAMFIQASNLDAITRAGDQLQLDVLALQTPHDRQLPQTRQWSYGVVSQPNAASAMD